MIAIVDVGLGNVGSVANMLRKVGADAVRTDDGAVVAEATRIVLPGVGSFDVAMDRLRDRGLIGVLTERAGSGVPVLGICLGMQLLADGSDEGMSPGLGWIPGHVRRLTPGALPVPHMGWNTVHPCHDDTIVSDLDDDARFYFVHSYAFVPDRPEDSWAETIYGEPFVSVVGHDNVLGVQFHPEKSHRHGMALLRCFCEGVPCTAPA